MQAYSDPKRESDPRALPDLEVFELTSAEAHAIAVEQGDDGEAIEPGWYWQARFPGCLPDGEPMGPFETAEEALADAREGVESHESEED